MDVLNSPNDSIAVDSQTNATAIATLAAPGTAFKWRVTGLSASFSGAAVATPVRAVLAINGVNIGRGISTNDGWQQSFVNPLEGAANGAITLTLTTGGAGAVGDVMLAAIKCPVTPMPA